MPTIDETLTLLRCSVPDRDPSIPEYTEEILERKRQGLIDQACVLTQHEENLNKALTEFEIQVLHIQTRLYELKRLSVLPDALVYFVSLLEVANQFFEFIESAKQVYDFEGPYSSTDIHRTLLLDQQLASKFNKLGKMEISEAAQAIFCQVYDKQSGTKRIDPNQLGWIYRLVYKARVEGYVMDQNPSVELEKMMKFEPVVYDRYFTREPLPVKCTEKSTEEAHKKYSQLVTTILAKSEESFNEKLTSTAIGARNLKHKFTPAATSARNNATLGEKSKLTSSVGSDRNKESARNLKHKFTPAATSARNIATLGEKSKLTSSVGSDRNKENDKERLISASNGKRPFVMTGATGKVAKAKVMLTEKQIRALPGGNGWAPMPPPNTSPSPLI